ncbi:bactofilin family protein [Varunaivibrio sulfuroxidans]|uniref:bactofilin family protein n=1 Tax=Varunaivibrio sulfuroxidans TaxID=1773489 RepID=UPI001FB255DC|nr:polymer-forming cytoskeletal protein [Varunaivibrio sulfuroxidans]
MQSRPSVPSIISTDLKITGDLVSAGEIQIDGTILGDIRSRVLLVGEQAQITGEIIADTVRVHGTVNGQIKAKTVNLAKNAHVVGDILHENLSIEKGAFLEGHITRLEDGVDLLKDREQASSDRTLPRAATAMSDVRGVVKGDTRPSAPSGGSVGATDGGRHPSPDERVNLVINKSQQGLSQPQNAAQPSPGAALGKNAAPTPPSGREPEPKKTVLS